MKDGPAEEPRRKVLLLENDPGLAHVLGLMLRQEGCQVTCCPPGGSDPLARLAPARLRDDSIDLVIAHISGKTDEKMVGRLRTVAALLPVIVIAAYGQEQGVSGRGSQPWRLLNAPLEAEDLRQCLDQVFKDMKLSARHGA